MLSQEEPILGLFVLIWMHFSWWIQIRQWKFVFWFFLKKFDKFDLSSAVDPSSTINTRAERVKVTWWNVERMDEKVDSFQTVATYSGLVRHFTWSESGINTALAPTYRAIFNVNLALWPSRGGWTWVKFFLTSVITPAVCCYYVGSRRLVIVLCFHSLQCYKCP